MEPGEIVDQAGTVLGRHDGIIRYTIGQRRGLQLGHQVSGGEALYVVGLDAERHRVIVGPKSALGRDRVLVREVNWLGDAPLGQRGERVEVKLRSAQPATPASVRGIEDGAAEILLDAPQDGVAPGQAAVFYRGDRVLGGGWIASAHLTEALAA